MNKDQVIVITGAAGFIGSCMVQYLNSRGYENLILVDDFSFDQKRKNWASKKYKRTVEREELFSWLKRSDLKVDVIIHLGARTDTAEFDYAIHEKLNVQYSMDIWNYCTLKQIPLIYASSAATYGGGELGFNDDHDVIEKLQPLNDYGISKNEFDKWSIKQRTHPLYFTGLKFFNVYGPNEYHKGRMASVVWHAFNQIKQNGYVNLFKSYRDGFNDGEQLRDFVYVIDLLKVIYWMLQKMLSNDWSTEKNGLYNLGTGLARSFYALASSTFAGLNLTANIKFIAMPEDIRDNYQYFTEANMKKLHDAGYNESFFSLESGIYDYVKNYLMRGAYY